MDPQQRLPRYEAYVCSNGACRAYRWADIAQLRGETHCVKCFSIFKKVPELRPYKVDGTKGKGKGEHNRHSSQAKGGGKGGKSKGGTRGTGDKPADNPKKEATKVTLTFDRTKLDADPVLACRTKLAALQNICGKESQAALDAADELKHLLLLRDSEKTPTQKATDKRRQLRDARKRLAKRAVALDAAEAALEKAQDEYDSATDMFKEQVRIVDSLEEELQLLEEAYLRPQAEAGPQRDLLAERAQEVLDAAILASGGQDEDGMAIQQHINGLYELLDKRASNPRKKTRIQSCTEPDAYPAVPADQSDEEGDGIDARLDDDVDEIDMDKADSKTDRNSRLTASAKILAKHSSRATRDYISNKGQTSTTSKDKGKGGAKGNPQHHPTAWGKGPTPAEAHGQPKRPGIQKPDGGEGGGGTASPPRDAEAKDRPDTSRNQGGDGQLA